LVVIGRIGSFKIEVSTEHANENVTVTSPNTGAATGGLNTMHMTGENKHFRSFSEAFAQVIDKNKYDY